MGRASHAAANVSLLATSPYSGDLLEYSVASSTGSGTVEAVQGPRSQALEIQLFVTLAMMNPIGVVAEGVGTGPGPTWDPVEHQSTPLSHVRPLPQYY